MCARFGVDKNITMSISLLCCRNGEQLRVCGLEQGNPQRKVDTHDPVFGGAGKESIENIGNHTQDPVDMKGGDGADGQRNVSNAQVREMPISNEKDGGR